MSPLPFKSISFIGVAGQMLLNRAQRFTYSAARDYFFASFGFLVLGERDEMLIGCIVHYSQFLQKWEIRKQARKECCCYSYQMLEDSERTHNHKSYTVHALL